MNVKYKSNRKFVYNYKRCFIYLDFQHEDTIQASNHMNNKKLSLFSIENNILESYEKIQLKKDRVYGVMIYCVFHAPFSIFYWLRIKSTHTKYSSWRSEPCRAREILSQ
jgi:hypothetical protein